ncbi:MAG TPA: UDP-N-acetylmuramoyl-L-alanyl-D-glutamate--2,6-diaminopimelate ligase [Spirochaetia bacterium]|nr:UDP-N-acetylmuramoyl-L-alanyl-D-glutamate--2,6-diaminopimelate ligase [Spirochaetia bacterium]
MKFEKRLSYLTNGLDFLIPVNHAGAWFTGANTAGKGAADPEIRGIAYDSRRVEPGFLFVALRGEHTDGHRFLHAAVEHGAAALVVEDETQAAGLAVPVLLAADSRRALSALSARLYDYPAESLYVIGVTGTDGKSTTVSFIHQLLELSGLEAGFLSTVAVKTDREVIDNPFRQSTPEAPEIQGLLRAMADAGKKFAVVEATSHGLSPKTHRLADVSFDAAVLTNIGHEHLEFHGSREQYRDDKANLFRALVAGKAKTHGLPRTAVVNADDPEAGYFIRALEEAGDPAAYGADTGGSAVAVGKKSAADDIVVRKYGIRSDDADLTAVDITPSGFGTRFLVKEKAAETKPLPQVELSLPGVFNVENTLAALLCVTAATGASLSRMGPLVVHLTPVRGRLEKVDRGQSFTVIVDFAHTPQAFSRLLPMMKERTQGRVIVVFGSAGERDRAKRAMQGKEASRYADVIVLADEDPRGETPEAILEEIAAGCQAGDARKKRDESLFLIPDRKAAIRKAFSLARPGDTVLLLGKGHEKSIIYRDRVLPWNERQAAEELLSEMGFSS